MHFLSHETLMTTAWTNIALASLPPLPANQLVQAVLGGGGSVLSIIWIALFLRQIRPALAQRLSVLLGVPIDAGARGLWAATPPAPRTLGCIVALADLAILLLGGLGPLVLVSLVVFLFGGP